MVRHIHSLLSGAFERATDLSRWDAHEIAAVAATVSSRPRKILGWKTPAEPSTNIYAHCGLVLRPPIESAQFTSWAFTRRAKESGLVPSMGSIGDCYDNAVIESFWGGRVQTELLDRRRWRTRIELANALFEYLETFHNRRRLHSALGMLTPIEYEKLHTPATA